METKSKKAKSSFLNLGSNMGKSKIIARCRHIGRNRFVSSRTQIKK